MLITEITTSNKTLLSLTGINIDDLLNSTMLDALQALVKSNSPTLNKKYITLIDQYVNDLKFMLDTKFEDPDIDIDQIKIKISKMVKNIEDLKSQLRF